MRETLTFLAFIIFGLACGGAAPEEADVPEGKEVFEKYCVPCHGNNGDLAVNGAKKFSESTLNEKERVLVITNGRNMMTPYKGIINEKEIKAVAAYTIILTNKK
jgi:mono/diheme cytochrome c family protein